jgi:hypothetical protein
MSVIEGPGVKVIGTFRPYMRLKRSLNCFAPALPPREVGLQERLSSASPAAWAAARRA